MTTPNSFRTGPDLHGHFGFQNIPAGTMSKATFTRENLIDHMQRLAFYGVGAAVAVGDLVDRSDMKGGRTGWGDVPLRLRDEVVPGAALFHTSGVGMAWPGSGAQGDPSRVDVSYPVSSPEEARAAVDDYVKMKPDFIKIWVDSRRGTKKTLTPELYRAIADEAHKFGVPVGVHNVTLADAKELLRELAHSSPLFSRLCEELCLYAERLEEPVIGLAVSESWLRQSKNDAKALNARKRAYAQLQALSKGRAD